MEGGCGELSQQAEAGHQCETRTADEGIVEMTVAEMIPDDSLVGQTEAYMTGIACIHVVGSLTSHVDILCPDTCVEPQTTGYGPLVGQQTEQLMLMAVVILGVGVIGIALAAVEQQQLRVFLYFVSEEIHGGVDASVIQPVVDLCPP